MRKKRNDGPHKYPANRKHSVLITCPYCKKKVRSQGIGAHHRLVHRELIKKSEPLHVETKTKKTLEIKEEKYSVGEIIKLINQLGIKILSQKDNVFQVLSAQDYAEKLIQEFNKKFNCDFGQKEIDLAKKGYPDLAEDIDLIYRKLKSDKWEIPKDMTGIKGLDTRLFD